MLFPLTHSFQFAQPGAVAGQGGGSGGKKKNRLPPFVVFSELLVTTKSYMRGVTAVEGDWLLGAGGGTGGLFTKVPVEDKEEKPTAEAAAAAYTKARLLKGRPSAQQQQGMQRMTPQHLAANQGRSGGVSGNAPTSK